MILSGTEGEMKRWKLPGKKNKNSCLMEQRWNHWLSARWKMGSTRLQDNSWGSWNAHFSKVTDYGIWRVLFKLLHKHWLILLCSSSVSSVSCGTSGKILIYSCPDNSFVGLFVKEYSFGREKWNFRQRRAAAAAAEFLGKPWESRDNWRARWDLHLQPNSAQKLNFPDLRRSKWVNFSASLFPSF